MGYQGRAGMYNYGVLERRFGARNIDRLNPDLAPLMAGDQMPFAPGLPMTVAMADPPHALVLWQVVTGGKAVDQASPHRGPGGAGTMAASCERLIPAAVRHREPYGRLG